MDNVSGVALQPRRVSSLGAAHAPSHRLHGSQSQANRSVYSNSSSPPSEIVIPPIRLTPIGAPDALHGVRHTQGSVDIDSSHLHPSVRQNDYHGIHPPGALHTDSNMSSTRHPSSPIARLGLAGMEVEDADTTMHPRRPSSSASFASSSNLSNGGSADVPSTPAELLIPLTNTNTQRSGLGSRRRSGSLAPVRSLTSIRPHQSRAGAMWGRNGRQGSEGEYDGEYEYRSDDGSTGPGSSNAHGDAETGGLGPRRGQSRSIALHQGQGALRNDDIDQEQYQLYAEPTSPISLATSANLPPTTGSFRATPKASRGTYRAPNSWHAPTPTPFAVPVALTASSSTVANAMQIITTATPPLSLTDLPNFPAEQKPPFTYPVLIRLAIMGSPQRRLLLSQIYAAIEDKFPWYKENASKAWKASIRHCLSLNKEFVRIQRAADDTTHGGGGWWSVDDGATGVKRPRKRRNQMPPADSATQSESQIIPLGHFTSSGRSSPFSYSLATPRPHLGPPPHERRYRTSSYAAPTATRVNPYPQHDRGYHSPVLSRGVGSPVPESFPPLSPEDHGFPQSNTLLGNQNQPLPRSSLKLPPLQLLVSGRSRPNPMRISSLVHEGQTSGLGAPTAPT